jgi:hypothetical protein
VDTVEFFGLISELGLTAQEKADIVAFMRTLWPIFRPASFPPACRTTAATSG